MSFITKDKDRVAIIAPGVSLMTSDIMALKEARVFTIAIGDAGRVKMTDADILYHADATWWYNYKGCPEVSSARICIEKLTYGNVYAMRRSPKQDGIDLNFPYLVTGNNSGYQAINLAMYSNPKEIILLGYDMKKTDGKHNIIGDHPPRIKRPADFDLFIDNISTLAPVLDNMRVKVYNCSLDSALTCFDKKELKDVL